MPKYTKVPAISGKRLIKLLQKDGWEVKGKRTHGIALVKQASQRTMVTIIPFTGKSLPDGTLNAILGQKQSRIGRDGLINLLNKHGL